MVPGLPAACRNSSLQKAYNELQYARAKNRPARVADYEVQIFEQEKICLVKEIYNPEEPKVSLTNSMETAIVLICLEHRLCPSVWTFVEYANGGGGKGSYQEYDIIVLEGGNIGWKYIWHNDVKGEREKYSDQLMINRVMQYRNGAQTIL